MVMVMGNVTVMVHGDGNEYSDEYGDEYADRLVTTC